MLDEYKSILKEHAGVISGWEKLDRNQLCNKYIESKENNDGFSENYLSAIIYKFWNVITHNYNAQPYKTLSEEDCLDYCLEGIMYALDHHIWTNPRNSLYKDPNGPEKAINVAIYSGKVNSIVAKNRDNRKLNYNSVSLDELKESNFDTPDYKTSIDDFSDSLSTVIKKAFNDKDYLLAFGLDGIINYDCFDDTRFNIKKLKKHLRTLDSNYCNIFSSNYKIDSEKVNSSIIYITGLKYSELDRRVLSMFEKLRSNNDIIKLLED